MSALAVREEAPSSEFPAPRVTHVPEGKRHYELVKHALELCWKAGLVLDPWQEYCFQHSLRLRPDGKWAALEVGLCVPRQNGKGSFLEARELVALFFDDDRWPQVRVPKLVIHSAHEAKTAHEAFERLRDLIVNCPEMRAKLKGAPGPVTRAIRESVGGESITLKDGRVIRFRTRTKGGGRGLSGDLVIFDEAMVLPETMHAAVWPIITARENPQVIYTGSAVDKTTMPDGVVFSRVRHRGEQKDPDLMYVEWSIPAPRPEAVRRSVAADPRSHEQANPSYGRRLSPRVIAVEQRSLSPRGFATERLGVGDWPDPEGSEGRTITEEMWDRAIDSASKIARRHVFAFDVRPDRSGAALAVAGRRADGKIHTELIKATSGTTWVVDDIEKLRKRYPGAPIYVDSVGPSAPLLLLLEERRVRRIETTTTREFAQACGSFYDGIDEGLIWHLDDSTLVEAVAGLEVRKVGESWVWSRATSASDITPLVAMTLAAYGVSKKRDDDDFDPAEMYGGLNDADEALPEPREADFVEDEGAGAWWGSD